MINYDDFKKIEIKIGQIVSAEKIPDTDKLLKLEVSFGYEDKRQVVSGIAEYFPEPEDLIGILCPFVTNLKPRVIRGFESQAMILGVKTDTGFALLKPEGGVSAGSVAG